MCHRRLRAEHNLGLLIPFVPVCRSYRAPRTPKTVARTPWLELASADGPWRSRLHASTIIFGSMVLTDAVYTGSLVAGKKQQFELVFKRLNICLLVFNGLLLP